MKKKLCSAAAALLLLAAALLPAAALDGGSASAALSLDGSKLSTDAIIQQDIIYLPLRAACEALGYQVSWSSAARTVTAQKGDRQVELSPDGQTITVGDQTIYFFPQGGDGGFLNQNGSLYLSADLFDRAFPTAARYSEADRTVTLRSVSENELSITTMTLKSEDEHLIVSLQYPQLYGLTDWEVQGTVNSVFTKAAASCVESGLNSAFYLIQDEARNAGYTATCGSYLNYQVTLNQSGLFDAVLDDYQYAGGAHGGTFRDSYLFDLSTGKVLSLADLMKPGSNYTALIDAAVRAEIDRRVANGDLYEFDGMEFQTIGDDPDFCLTNDAVVIYFQQYAYFPYAAGIQTFAIPYEDLSACLRDEYAFLK